MTRAVFVAALAFLSVAPVSVPEAARPIDPKPPQRQCVPTLREIVVSIAVAENVPPWLFCELVNIESRWNPKAININKNGTIDRGLYQLNTTAHPNIDPYDVEAAGHYAARYLRGLYDRLGSWRAALEAYNCGPGRWKRGAPERSREYAREILSKEPKGRKYARDQI